MDTLIFLSISESTPDLQDVDHSDPKLQKKNKKKKVQDFTDQQSNRISYIPPQIEIASLSRFIISHEWIRMYISINLSMEKTLGRRSR